MIFCLASGSQAGIRLTGHIASRQVSIPLWALVHLPVVVTLSTAAFTPNGWVHSILYVLFENAMGIVKLGAVIAGGALLDGQGCSAGSCLQRCCCCAWLLYTVTADWLASSLLTEAEPNCSVACQYQASHW